MLFHHLMFCCFVKINFLLLFVHCAKSQITLRILRCRPNNHNSAVGALLLTILLLTMNNHSNPSSKNTASTAPTVVNELRARVLRTCKDTLSLSGLSDLELLEHLSKSLAIWKVGEELAIRQYNTAKKMETLSKLDLERAIRAIELTSIPSDLLQPKEECEPSLGLELIRKSKSLSPIYCGTSPIETGNPRCYGTMAQQAWVNPEKPDGSLRASDTAPAVFTQSQMEPNGGQGMIAMNSSSLMTLDHHGGVLQRCYPCSIDTRKKSNSKGGIDNSCLELSSSPVPSHLKIVMRRPVRQLTNYSEGLTKSPTSLSNGPLPFLNMSPLGVTNPPKWMYNNSTPIPLDDPKDWTWEF